MISRALGRDIADFSLMIEAHLARMIEEFKRLTRRETTSRKEQLLTSTMVLAFRERDLFDPLLETPWNWFARCLELAKVHDILVHEDEREMLKAIQPPPEPEARVWTTESTNNVVEPLQKKSKDCPPCWKCKYHQGWLPTRDVEKANYPTTEIGWICYELDKRKVEIANYVRGHYPETLLED